MSLVWKNRACYPEEEELGLSLEARHGQWSGGDTGLLELGVPSREARGPLSHLS